MKANVKTLGQVFTPDYIVEKMIKLINNKGNILEPSVGNGAFLSHLGTKAVGVEIDHKLTDDDRVIFDDFFNYSTNNKFDTIIGNPPYVRHQDIKTSTKKLLPISLFDKRTNLYLFFINKCINHLNNQGELIFITPRDFIKATSAKGLNTSLYNEGSITHFYDLGDAKIFYNVTPNCAIWRWVKGRKSRRMMTGGSFCYANGQIWFGETSKSCLYDYFDIKVGAVSGADDVFANEKRANVKMVCSQTAKNGITKKVIYNKKDKSLLPHKQRLINRKIRQFDESNWWEWGRKFCDRDSDRIYVNVKTRNKNPFFIGDAKAYDGSVLALFPRENINLSQAVNKLNNTDWEKLGFICDGRFLFTQRSLATAPVEL